MENVDESENVEDIGEIDEEDEPHIPWHFWLVVVLFGIYMAYRVVQIAIRIIF